MPALSQEQIFKDLQGILKELSTEWEYSGEITQETGFLNDLGFESIDIVAFGSAIEDHYRQSFPFAQFLSEVAKRQAQDVYVGEIVELIYRNLDGHHPQQGG